MGDTNADSPIAQSDRPTVLNRRSCEECDESAEQLAVLLTLREPSGQNRGEDETDDVATRGACNDAPP